MHKLLAVAFLGALCASPGLVAAAAPSTQILQQRTADGRLLLTDQPAAGAKTERSWQVDREDPAAARQRAIDVKAEANLVSERVQRMLDQQQRRADDDALRMRMATLERERTTGADAQTASATAWLSLAVGDALPLTPIGPHRQPGFPRPDRPASAKARHGGHGKLSGWIARKSLTLVNVGPVTSRSPRAAKNE